MKTISPRFTQTAIGALVGGSLLEQDNDALGLSMGLGIGALVGYNFRVNLPDSHKMIYRDQLVSLPQTLSALDQEKQDLLRAISNLNGQLPGLKGVPYDYTDVYGTLNEDNIKQAISDARDIEELRRIRIAAYNPGKFTFIGDPRGLEGGVHKTNPKNNIVLDGDLSEAMNALRFKFSTMGYTGQELESKLSIFKGALGNADRMVLDVQTDKVILFSGKKTTEFKISSSHSNGFSSYMDTNNFYSVRSINPLASYILNHDEMRENSIASLDGFNIAKELGLGEEAARELDNVHKDGLQALKAIDADLSKYSPKELADVTRYIGQNKISGFQPEDLKALLYNTDIYKEHAKDVDTLIDSAYQHRQDESARRALGARRQEISKYANNLTKRLSGQQDFGTGFYIDHKTGKINPDRPFKDIGYKARGEVESEHRQFLDYLRGHIQGVDDGKKADHNNIASNGKLSYQAPYNFNAPMERNPYTQSRDTRHVNLGNSKNSIANTFERMHDQGMIPNEFDTAIVSKRVSVDEGKFNLLADLFNRGTAVGSLSDGGSIASKRHLSGYQTRGGRTFTVSPDKGGILQISDDIVDLMKARSDYGITDKHTGLKADRILQQLGNNMLGMDKIEFDLTKTKGKPLPLQATPDPKFDPNDLVSLTSRAHYISNQNKRFIASNPSLKDEVYRPTTIEGAREKILADHARGVPAKYLGFETASNNIENAIEAKHWDERKLQARLDRSYTAAQRQLGAIRDSVVAKMSTEGTSKALEEIVSTIDGFNVRDMKEYSRLSEMIQHFNDVADKTFRPGDAIGVNGNGTLVKFPDEFKHYRLEGTTFSSVDPKNGNLQGNFVFNGYTNIAEMDTLKVYGVDHKQNMILQEANTYSDALSRAMFLSEYDLVDAEMGMKYQVKGQLNKDGSPRQFQVRNKNWVGKTPTDKKDGIRRKSGKKDEYFFIKKRGSDVIERVTKTELGSLIHSVADRLKSSPPDIGVISSIDNNGQKITALVADTLINSDPTEVVEKLMAKKQVGDTLVNTKDSISHTIASTINRLTKRVDGKVEKGEAWAMGQIASALTEGKASMSSLLGMRTLAMHRLSNEIDELPGITPQALKGLGTPETQVKARATLDSINNLVDAYSIANELQDLSGNEFREAFRQRAMTEFDSRLRDVEVNFQSAGALGKFLPNADQSFADLFRYAYQDYGVSVMFASPDASQGYSTGSGRLGKSISHIAQTQLLAAGMDVETLNLFGTLDPSELYDYKALTTLDAEVDTPFNRFLDDMIYKDGEYSKVGYQKARALIERINVSDPDQVKQALKDYGAGEELLNQEFIRFSLDSNEHGLTNIPIYTRNTDRHSTYIADDGKVTSKPIQKAQAELLEVAFEKKYSPVGRTDKDLNKSIKKYVREWTKAVGNQNNPMLKSTLARYAPNSSYSKIIATDSVRLGNLVDLAQGDGEYRGRSFAGVSRAKAAQVVQEYYGDTWQISPKTTQQLVDEGVDLTTSTVLSIDDFIDNKGLISVTSVEGNDVPLYTLLNREPAHSSFSISPYQLMVLSDEELGSSGNLDSVYIHKNDFHYTSLMVGDFDNDHVLMYSVFKQITDKEARTLEKYTEKIASVRNDLMPLMKGLGVKGSDASQTGIYDVTRSIDQLEANIGAYKPFGMTLEEYRGSDQYWDDITEIANERRGYASVKGGTRKILSAPAVKLSTYLATAVHNSSELNQDFLVHAAAKTLNHAVVENIIKTQHISTEEFANKPRLDVERLFQMRDDLAKGVRAGGRLTVEDYKREMTKFFDDMVDVAMADKKYSTQVQQLEARLQSEHGMGLKDIARTIVSEDVANIKNPAKAPTNILEYSKVTGAVSDADFDARILAEGARDMGSKVHGDNLTLLPLEAVDTDYRKSTMMTYDELLKAAKTNLIENKKAIMVGGAMLGVAAVLTQKNPDLSASPSVRADTQAGNIAPAMASNIQAKANDALQTPGRERSEYIRPGTGMERVKQNYTVNASYTGPEGRETVGARDAIFGRNITNVNINYNNGYY